MTAAAFSLFIVLIALALGYGWLRIMHHPFTVKQRKMWTYYVSFCSAVCALNPLFVAIGRLWGIPLKLDAAITIALLLFWMVITFGIVGRMSRPGGRFSPERQEPIGN